MSEQVGWMSLMGVLSDFEAAWASGQPRPIDDFLPVDSDPTYLPFLEELVLVEMEFSWKRWNRQQQSGSSATLQRPASIEDYLRRFPKLQADELLRQIVRQEFYLRVRFADAPDVDDYLRRYPCLKDASELEQFQLMETDLQRGGQTLPLAQPSIVNQTFGDYEIEQELGRGGMGIVYRARQISTDRPVALKVIRRDRLDTVPADSQHSTLERFRHEAQATAKLQHDNIITVYEVGTVDDQPFYSMHFVEGVSLGDKLRLGPLPPRQAARYIEAVARALHEAHQAGILHRDLKPHNIMIDRKADRALLADFGLAKLLEGAEEMTRSGEMMGTPPYMSPEQVRDSSKATTLSDVYSLGATLYDLLTARPPFHAGSAMETLRQVLDEQPVPPRRLNPAIDRDVETICLKCLAKEPQQRYASAAELADDLGRYVRHEPIQARPIGLVGRATRWCRRNAGIAGLGATALGLLLVALIASIVGYVSTSFALQKSKDDFRKSIKTIREFSRDVNNDVLLNQPGMTPLQERLLERALDGLRNYLEQDRLLSDPLLRQELGETYFLAGNARLKIVSAEAALKDYSSALRYTQDLLAEQPGSTEYRELLGSTYNQMMRVHVELDDIDSAFDSIAKSEQVRKGLYKEFPSPYYARKLANTVMNAAVLHRNNGEIELARKRFAEAQHYRSVVMKGTEVDQDFLRDRALNFYNQGELVLHEDDPTDQSLQQSEKHLESAVQGFSSLLDEATDDIRIQRLLYRSNVTLGEVQDYAADLQEMAAKLDSQVDQALQKRDVALDNYARALKLAELVSRQNPKVDRYRLDLAGLLMTIAEAQYKQGYLLEATESYRESQRIFESDPDLKQEGRFDRSMILFGLAYIHQEQNDLDSARKCVLEAKGLLSELSREAPGVADYQRQLKVANDRLTELRE